MDKRKVDMATSHTIVGEQAVKRFIHDCVIDMGLGMGFHPDTPFEDYVYNISIKKNRQVFSEFQAYTLNRSITECFAECKKLGLDIYEITFDIMKPLREKIK